MDVARESPEPNLLDIEMWDSNRRQRRQWFGVIAPALIALIAFNFARLSGGTGELVAVAVATLIFASVVVAGLLARTRRRIRRLAPADRYFSASAVLLPKSIIGSQSPWTNAVAAGSPSQLGAEGVMWLDDGGFHWASAERKSHVQIDVPAGNVAAVSLVHLWMRSYGFGIATTGGQRAGFVVPKINRDVLASALASAHLPAL